MFCASLSAESVAGVDSTLDYLDTRRAARTLPPQTRCYTAPFVAQRGAHSSGFAYLPQTIHGAGPHEYFPEGIRADLIDDAFCHADAEPTGNQAWDPSTVIDLYILGA